MKILASLVAGLVALVALMLPRFDSAEPAAPPGTADQAVEHVDMTVAAPAIVDVDSGADGPDARCTDAAAPSAIAAAHQGENTSNSKQRQARAGYRWQRALGYLARGPDLRLIRPA